MGKNRNESARLIEALIAENNQLKTALDKLKNDRNISDSDQPAYREDRFLRLFDEMNSASAFHRMIFDEQGKPVDYEFIRVNKMFETFTGLKAENIIGRRIREVLPETEQYWIEKYGQVVVSGEPVEFENYSGALDRYYNVHAYRPMKDHFVVTFIDITEQKRSQIKINETKAFYERILETTHDGIWVTNQDDVFVFANSAIEKIAMARKKDIIGHNIIKDFPKDAVKGILPYYLKTKKTNKAVEYEATAVTMAGKKIILKGWMVPILENNEFKGIICSSQDITESREAEKSLAEQKLRLQEVVGNLHGIVFRCENDENWTMSFVSAGVTNLTGYTPKEILGNKVISYKEIIHPEDTDLVDKRISDAVSRNGKYKIEYRIHTKDGNCKWVYEQGTGIKDEAGKLDHLEGYIFDISDRKKMELEIIEKNKEIAAQNEEFISINEELQSTIEQIQVINNQLREAKLKAEESDRLKSAFLANMSHEIRTPMNSIIGFSGLLTERGLKWKKRKQYSRLILSAGEYLLRIIDDIVDIAKIESNLLLIESSGQNLHSLLDETYSYHLQSKLLKQKSQLELWLDVSNVSPDLILDTDPVRFKQVINNLISNAIKNTLTGHVGFGVKQVETEEKRIVFYVEDTGIGIPEESKEIIFERFMQVRRENPVAGTGLGLSICKGILNLMNGDIWMESEPEKGTTFYFSLPYNPANRQQQTGIKPARSFRIPELKNKLIYIAEDDYSSFLYLREVLAITNARIAHATNGQMLVEMVLQETPDLVLADISMPVMSGIDAIKQLRAMNYTFPVIAQTAYALIEEKDSCLKAGCSSYISKPIDANLLFELINQSMEQ
ncbi:MAG: hypothetical protein A2W90_19760 [Bacteroidetes bacterium GWF2_42_66]|nr:MAG: hypothetical protein A2W92_13240 [Bacteroidetes bacterium GWA2_42_15]OFX98364.1 MAG: hypothetical protein A2W89_08125 [Bacteroidetes bacterium GWE2_42_39]OFY42749.1 MAG: hypothetical protein A2W90_19760 [Bacteroidetes bacterium GWF2_42_66]HBL74360.1 hypothetical protein [Prolixibacteraceae bacterium]HCR91399.1 hypothetical protein [Prolixibacteraceae bacterium]